MHRNRSSTLPFLFGLHGSVLDIKLRGQAAVDRRDYLARLTCILTVGLSAVMDSLASSHDRVHARQPVFMFMLRVRWVVMSMVVPVGVCVSCMCFHSSGARVDIRYDDACCGQSPMSRYEVVAAVGQQLMVGLTHFPRAAGSSTSLSMTCSVQWPASGKPPPSA